MNKNDFIKNKIQNYYKNKYKNEILICNYIVKRKEDIIFKIISNLANRANNCLKKCNIKRNHTHMELIGCNQNELKEHLEKNFKDGMSFDNYGEWEIDHIKPISLYNLDDTAEMLECFNYKNLQPLWKIENRKKGNKY